MTVMLCCFHLEYGQGTVSLVRSIVSLQTDKVNERRRHLQQQIPGVIDNWRPITLLCADFKIADEILADRLHTIIPKLIHKSQTGFQKGKNLGENLLKLLSVIDFCEITDTPWNLISFDFRKAFNTV